MIGELPMFGTAMYYSTQVGRHDHPDKAIKWIAQYPQDALQPFGCLQRASEWIEKYGAARRRGAI